ncbi:MAG: hypothetical protein NT106_10410 [Candidatus Sumerlaeota bacterium]|nr:hypothetical protein [Candidatus Sumerlaeota bacterium]
MPTREETSKNIVSLLEHFKYPEAFVPKTAWLGIYQSLMWYEMKVDYPSQKYLHIIDADKLLGTSNRSGSKTWQERARAVEKYLSRNLNIPIEDLPEKVDRLFQIPEYKGLQRQNPLGIGFAEAIWYLLKIFRGKEITWERETDAEQIFPGIHLPGRSTKPRIDILGTINGQPRVIISCKWSMRHDRINEITNECPIYKAAAFRSRTHLKFFVCSNEFDPARLDKVLNDDCIDGLIHVHKPCLTEICGLDHRLKSLHDLSELLTVLPIL